MTINAVFGGELFQCSEGLLSDCFSVPSLVLLSFWLYVPLMYSTCSKVFFDHLFCCLCNVNNINNLVINIIPLQLWCEVWSLLIQHFWSLVLFQGMIALRREATEVIHEDYMDGIMEVNAKKKANLMYYAWRKISLVNKQKKKLKMLSFFFIVLINSLKLQFNYQFFCSALLATPVLLCCVTWTAPAKKHGHWKTGTCCGETLSQ